MRLTHVKLAGFKSFVDPTTISTPGQLVGIVGPNGCGKSNVIDAVRWVLGESKASALRGESMQDVIFNGAGERKPVGRASVELVFDNSAGRIGGQWGQFVELSIKRVLTRDGDSNYYINNIPVRRRDIHDLFLGTGLGPRAYAIIEQGMISRVIEAKPEELRVFLEEAAGVSKYKERRKETEGRLADTRDNLARVEDIRNELASQLSRLSEQARIAAEYRELEARLRTSQHLSWYGKQQDAVRARERHTAEALALTTALEAIQAELRHAEASLEHLRTSHYAANDTVHERQAAFYSANAEVTRLEQQLDYARANETRLTEQVARLTEQVAALDGQQSTLASERQVLADALVAATTMRERSVADEASARLGLPALEQVLAAATQVQNQLLQATAAIEQDIRVGETRRDNHVRALAQVRTRHDRLANEIAQFAAPATDALREVEDQLEQERSELIDRQARQTALADAVQTLQAEQRAAGDQWQADSRALADLDARRQALASLQAKIGRGADIDGWRAGHALGSARQLWQLIDVDAGWEDAVEAVLRERLKGLEVDELDAALRWLSSGAPPSRLAVFGHGSAATAGVDALSVDALQHKVRINDAAVARAVADGVAHVRCQPDMGAALAARGQLAIGETFVTPQGHVVSGAGIVFFAPDSEIHGVIARARELAGLESALPALQAAAGAARATLEVVESTLTVRQQEYHGEGLALSSQQRRVHDLELELVELRKEAEARARRHAELTAERDAAATALAAEQAAHDTVARDIADQQSRLHDEFARRDAARHARNEADVALARGREQLRVAERAAQEAGFAERSVRERIAELERRASALATQFGEQQALLAKLGDERQSVDWTPVEEALQRQLALRGDAEQVLAAARDTLEALGGRLRTGDEARMSAEQKLDPARVRIQDMQLKEQAAQLAEQQFTEHLAEAQADLAALPDALKAWGRASLPAEITRISAAIAELGAVNLAALDELTQSQERKDYLDAQAADLTEALTTLESAIRQIDRESRQLLQTTFDVVSRNFAELFPMLFGGGEARLTLTGDEILDSGVQIFAQPPGKRNASIHLLSGGEKALTAISLVFALFQLNPAPFCLLDEVDAPLDDPNTDRFCQMVKKMSAETQFLFISHNKITMEMANQLVGITMPEPGVSRVVAVDISEALSLAERTAAVAA